MLVSIVIIKIIRSRRSTFGPLGSGRLPETSGDQMPAHNFRLTCQHNATSRRKNQSVARQYRAHSYPRHIAPSRGIWVFTAELHRRILLRP